MPEPPPPWDTQQPSGPKTERNARGPQRTENRLHRDPRGENLNESAPRVCAHFRGGP